MKENLDAAKSIIDSISFSAWSVILSLVTITSYWLTAIYLIVPGFYYSSPLFIYIMTGFVLASLWYSGMLFYSFLLLLVYRRIQVLKRFDWELIYSATYLYGSTYLGLSTYIGYVYHIRFRTIVICDFALLLLGFIGVVGLFVNKYRDLVMEVGREATTVYKRPTSAVLRETTLPRSE